jgi:predicted dehydrogenase
MKQVFLTNKEGIIVESVPHPSVVAGAILVRTAFSVISSGTEATSIAASGSVARKVMRNPGLVRSAWHLMSTAGPQVARELIAEKMGEKVALGYSAAGTVVAVGPGVRDLKVGMHVACGGAGHAVHAEIISVPVNLAVPVPEDVELREAAFATIGAVALQAVRRAEPRLGETIAVIGAGIVGQLTLQLLRAAGCRTVAVDRQPQRLALSEGRADWVIAADSPDLDLQIRAVTNGIGADAAIICAGTTAAAKSAMTITRSRGRVVLVGVASFHADAADLIGKELDVTGSRSYGPGRYDPEYELKGRDYPIEYVRWTERRNMAAFLDLAAAGRLAVGSLITHEFELDSAGDAYQLLKGEDASHLGIVLRYAAEAATPIAPSGTKSFAKHSNPRLGVVLVGGGGFARTVLAPNIARIDRLEPLAVVSGTGAVAAQLAKRTGAANCFSNIEAALLSCRPDIVIVANRHDAHVASVRTALLAGVHVLVEKPMALTASDCRELQSLASDRGVHLAVGFNRRMAPLAQVLKNRVAQRSAPIQMLYRVNAGRLPAGHWLDDPERGGGRMLGEACHFLDFACWMFDADPTALTAASADLRPAPQDFSIVLEYPRGTATILYTTCGHSSLPKERIEVAVGGAAFVLDNFERLDAFGEARPPQAGKGDKGYRGELAAFVDTVQGQTVKDLATASDGTRATILGLQSLRAIRTGIREVQSWRFVDSKEIDQELLALHE